MTDSCDILISGGGIAGLTAAAAFGAAGFNVVCVDPTPPITERDVDGSDLRTTAFLQPSRILLEQCGLWDRLDSHAAPLQVMRIVDAGGDTPEPRVVRDFNASDISEQPFGWNLPNWLLRREMVARLSELPNVDFRPGTATVSLFTRTAEAERRPPYPLQAGDRRGWAQLTDARGRGDFRSHHALRSKGPRLCRDTPHRA